MELEIPNLIESESKTRKTLLIEAINNSNDDLLIAKLLFQIQPKEKVDRSWDNAINGDELVSRVKKHIDTLVWEK